MLDCVFFRRLSILNNGPLRKLGIVFCRGTEGIKLAFKVQARQLRRQMKQLCASWALALKSDQDGCLFCIIPQRHLIVGSIGNTLKESQSTFVINIACRG